MACTSNILGHRFSPPVMTKSVAEDLQATFYA